MSKQHNGLNIQTEFEIWNEGRVTAAAGVCDVFVSVAKSTKK